MIPVPTKPLGGARYVFTEYIERNTQAFPLAANTQPDKQLWLGGHRLTDLTGCTIECGLSAVYSGSGSVYPVFFGTWRYVDAIPGNNHYHEINYFGFANQKMLICQRQGSTSYGTEFGVYQPGGARIDAVIHESTATATTPAATYKVTTRPENIQGDYGCPFVGNPWGWIPRYYYYRLSDRGYHMDCVPAYDRLTGLHGMYDKVNKQFYGSIYFTGPRG